MGRLNAARGLGLACALLACAGAPAAGDLSVETRRVGEAVEVHARATLHARREIVWATLTDYDRIAEFVPGFHESRVLERRGNTAIVRQRGEVRVLFLSFPIDVVVASIERPPWEIGVRALSGTLRRLDGGYRMEPIGDDPARGFVLHWTGVIEPEAGLPPLFGEVLVRATIEDQFAGMVREIERRAAAAAPPRGPGR